MWMKALARLSAFWEFLTRPTASIRDDEQRHQVRLLAGMLAALLLLTLLIAPIWVVFVPQFQAALPISAGLLLALGIGLLLSRTRCYCLAVYLLITLIPSTIFIIIVTAAGSGYIGERLLSLGALVISIMITSLLLSIRATVIVILLCLAFISAFLFVPDVPYTYVYPHIVYAAVTGALSVVAALVRSSYARQLKQNQQELNAFFNQSLSGCFFMELDEPLRWNNPADRQERLRWAAAHLRVTRVNDAMLEQYGASREQMLGMTTADFFAHDLEQAYDALGQMFDAGRLRVETHERRMDGTELIIEGDYVCFYDGHGRITGLFGVQRDVTQRSRAEQALRRSEARYRALFEQAHDAIIIVGLDGNCLEANQRAADLFGYSVAEMPNVPLRQVSADYGDSLNVLGRLLNGEAVPTYTRRFHKKNGEPLTAEVNVELVRDADGQPLYVQSVIRDISQRQQLEKSLRESEARYRSVVEVLSEGIVLQGIDGEIIACNSAAERILGLKKEQMMGRTSLDPRWRAIHEDGSDFPGETHPAMVTLRTGEALHEVIMGVHHPNGELRWISISTQPLVLPDAEQPYAVVASFTDITERKQAYDALREIEARQRALLNAIPDLMFRYHRDGTFLDYHAPDLSRLALPPEQFLGRNIREVLPELAQKHIEHTEQALQSGQEVVYEYSLMLEDGPTYFEARLVASGPDEVTAIVRDITFRKQAEEQAFALAVERARVKLLGRFIQTASHELRTPLAIMNTAVHLMARVNDADMRARYAARIEQQTLRLRQLIEMMLMMAQLDSDVPLNRRPTNLNNLLRQISAVTQEQARPSGQTVRFEPDERLPLVSVDGEWLVQAIRQVLDNALRFTPAGGRIDICTCCQDGSAIIAVQDTGIGISAAALPHIFERFWRQDEEHSTPGFGLGLSIAQKIVQLHGGSIDVESSEGAGTTFRMRLPIDKN